ncbi:MAG TPA: lysozyme [Conexibacter sp.]|jgi:GH24 family phage-related lysozyme (muramidase)
MSDRPHSLSSQGVQFIAAFEGFVDHLYDDAAPTHNATIGYGHLLHTGPATDADRRKYPHGITKPAALELLREDAAGFASDIAKSVKPTLSQAQFDALVSFAYNLGFPTLAASTLWREINGGGLVTELSSSDDGKRHAAQNTLRQLWVEYDHAGTTVLAGLEKRRQMEAHLFMTGEY